MQSVPAPGQKYQPGLASFTLIDRDISDQKPVFGSISIMAENPQKPFALAFAPKEAW